MTRHALTAHAVKLCWLSCVFAWLPSPALAGPPEAPTARSANRFVPGPTEPATRIDATRSLEFDLAGLQRVEVELWTCPEQTSACLASDADLDGLDVWRTDATDEGPGTLRIEIDSPRAAQGVVCVMAPPGPGATVTLAPAEGKTLWARVRDAEPRERVFADERTDRAVYDALANGDSPPTDLAVANSVLDSLNEDLAFIDGLEEYLVVHGEDVTAANALAQAAAALRLDAQRDPQSTGLSWRRRGPLDRQLEDVVVTGPAGGSSTYKRVVDQTRFTVAGPAVVDLRLRSIAPEADTGRTPHVRVSSDSGVDESLELSPTAASTLQATIAGEPVAVGLVSTRRIVIPPGRHTLTLSATAATALAATVRTRRYRLGESMTGKTAPAKLAKGKRRAETALGRQWAASLAWDTAPDLPAEDMAALLALVVRADPATLGTAAAIARELDVDGVDRRLAVGIATRLAHMAEPEAIDLPTRNAAAQAIAHLDPGGSAPQGLVLRARAVPITKRAQRSRALALATAAIRRTPQRTELRRRVQRIYWRRSQWSTLAPTTDAVEPLRIERMMVRRRPEGDAQPQATSPSRRSLWALPVDGRTVSFLAPTSPVFPDRPSVVTLRLHLGSPTRGGPASEQPDKQPGRYALTIDGKTRHGLALAPYERVVVALTPGPHELALSAPGATAFSNVALVDEQGRHASDGRLESVVAVGSDASVAYPLPPGGLGLARLAVRLPAAGTARLALVLEGGDGTEPQRHEVEISIDGRDEDVYPLSPELAPTVRHTVVVPLETHHSRMRVSSIEGEALVSVAIRRDATPDAAASPEPDAESTPVPAGGTPPRAREPALTAIARLSQDLQDSGTNTAARLERGHRLVDIEQYGLAREDLDAALAHDPALEADPLAQALVQRIEDRNDSRHLDVPLSDGMQILAPALLGLGQSPADYDTVLDVAATARAEGPAAALASMGGPPTGAVQAAIAAELAARSDSPRDAARTRLGAYDQSDHWPLAYAAAADYLDVLALDDGYRDAGVAYGLALQLGRETDTGRLRTLQLDAGRLSAWKRVSAAQNSAGFERIIEPERPPPNDAQALGQALLAPPWPHEDATYLWPGRRRIIRERLVGDRSLVVQAHCQILRPSRRTSETVRLELRVDDSVRELEVEPSRPSTPFQSIDVPLAAGEHRVELQLPNSEDGARCSVRALHDGKTIQGDRKTRWLTARPNRPFEVDLGGPVSVRLSLRRFDHDPKRAEPLRARVELFGFDADGETATEARIVREVELPSRADPSARPERSRPGAVGPEVEDIFLVAGSKPGRLRVTVPRDAVLVRVSLRQADAQAAAAQVHDSIVAADLAASDPGGLGEAGEVGGGAFVAPNAPLPPIIGRDIVDRETRFGTVTSDNRVGFDEIGDADLFVPRIVSTHNLDYRRELSPDRLWLRIGPTARIRQSSATAGGGRVSVRANFPRSRLRLGLLGEALVQAYDGSSAYSLRGTAFIDRPTQLTPRLELRPGVYFDARTQSLDPGTITDEEPQPRVYLRFVDDHPLVLRPELALRYLPLQDLVLALTARAPLNSDFASLDRFDADADLWAVASNMRKVLPEFSLGYQASIRLADANRSQTYVRHRVSAALGLGMWAKQAARVSFGLQNALFFADPFGLRNVASFYLRLDFAFGRGLRDYGPRELLFRQLKEQRDFAPVQPELARR